MWWARFEFDSLFVVWFIWYIRHDDVVVDDGASMDLTSCGGREVDEWSERVYFSLDKTTTIASLFSGEKRLLRLFSDWDLRLLCIGTSRLMNLGRRVE